MRMTRIATVLALALAAAPLVSAQEAATAPKEKKIRWSLMLGATFTDFTGVAADTAGLSSRVGGVGSIGLEYAISRSFAIELEASLLQKGAEQPTVTNRPGLGYRILYTEFPLLFKWNLSPDGGWQPVLLAGPSVAFELDCKMPFLYVTSVIDSNCYSLDYERKTTDFGGQVGIELHKGMWFAGARYMMGFSSLLSGTGAPELKNSGFMAGIGITF
jgi:hypothetical protein